MLHKACNRAPRDCKRSRQCKRRPLSPKQARSPCDTSTCRGGRCFQCLRLLGVDDEQTPPMAVAPLLARLFHQSSISPQGVPPAIPPVEKYWESRLSRCPVPEAVLVAAAAAAAAAVQPVP